MYSDPLSIQNTPELRRPHLVIAFAGWPDAAEVATGALRYLVAKFRANKIGSISSDLFYDFSSIRPVASIENGKLEQLRFPANYVYSHSDHEAGQDYILILATEPHLRWETYVRQITRLIDQFAVKRVITLGCMFDAVPHTKEAKVTAGASTPELRQILRAGGVKLINYDGPSSIHSLLQRRCEERGVSVVNLWGHAPLYVRVPSNPQVCWALLNRLTIVSPLSVDLSDLRAAGDYLTANLDKLMTENLMIRVYVHQLEELYDGGIETTTYVDDSAEQIIREVETFLRRQHRKRENSGN